MRATRASSSSFCSTPTSRSRYVPDQSIVAWNKLTPSCRTSQRSLSPAFRAPNTSTRSSMRPRTHKVATSSSLPAKSTVSTTTSNRTQPPSLRTASHALTLCATTSRTRLLGTHGSRRPRRWVISHQMRATSTWFASRLVLLTAGRSWKRARYGRAACSSKACFRNYIMRLLPGTQTA